jgi:hypothetical protein
MVNVRTRISASARVAATIARSELTSIIRTVVANRTPAKAASGICETSGATVSTTTSRTTAWVSAASFEVAPARTFTAVRAIAAVPGIPPNNGAARFARP